MTAREDYQELMQKRLDDWKAEIEQFKAGAGKIEADARVNYDKGLYFLHARQEEAWTNFDKMKAASESNWEQFKSNMDKAGADLKAAGENMTAQLRK
jgi:chaperonin cofactor prefoldin